jgi:hypothetical protein
MHPSYKSRPRTKICSARLSARIPASRACRPNRYRPTSTFAFLCCLGLATTAGCSRIDEAIGEAEARLDGDACEASATVYEIGAVSKLSAFSNLDVPDTIIAAVPTFEAEGDDFGNGARDQLLRGLELETLRTLYKGVLDVNDRLSLGAANRPRVRLAFSGRLERKSWAESALQQVQSGLTDYAGFVPGASDFWIQDSVEFVRFQKPNGQFATGLLQLETNAGVENLSTFLGLPLIRTGQNRGEGGDIESTPTGMTYWGKTFVNQTTAETRSKFTSTLELDNHPNDQYKGNLGLVPHLDEVVTILPSAGAACGYAIGYADATRAIELLVSGGQELFNAATASFNVRRCGLASGCPANPEAYASENPQYRATAYPSLVAAWEE